MGYIAFLRENGGTGYSNSNIEENIDRFDPFIKKLTVFKTQLSNRINGIKKEFEEVKKMIETTAALFGEAPKDFDPITFFSALNNFMNEFIETQKETRQKMMKPEKTNAIIDENFEEKLTNGTLFRNAMLQRRRAIEEEETDDENDDSKKDNDSFLT